MVTAVQERKQFTEVRVHQIAGKPPDGSADWQTFAASIPLYPGIDKDMLYKGDDDPFHVTLDIFRANVTSENGMFYDEAFIEELLSQLPGLGAKDGHTAWSDTGSFADEADWIGHIRVEDTWYAKAYIPPGKTRDNVRRIMARKGKLRTSIETWGVPVPILDPDGKDTGMFRLSDPELEFVDMVRATAAALKNYTAGNPIYSSETKKSEQKKETPMSEPISIKDVPETVRAEIIKEAKLQADAAKVAEIAAERDSLAEKLTEAQAEVTTLKTSNAEKDALIVTHETALKLANDRIAAQEKVEFETALDAHIAGYFPWKVTTEQGKSTLASMQTTMKALLLSQVKETSMSAVEAASQGIYDTNLKALAEAAVRGISGGAGVVAPRKADTSRKTEDERKDLKSSFGLS